MVIGRIVLAVAGWLIAGALAIGVGVAVLGMLGRPLADSVARPMTPDEVRNALALSAPTPSATRSPEPGSSRSSGQSPSGHSPQPAPERSPQPEARFRLIPSVGGQAIVGCDGGLARLRSWAPAQGFQVDDVDPGPDRRVRVKFESDEPEIEVEIEARCVGGVPTARVTEHD